MIRIAYIILFWVVAIPLARAQYPLDAFADSLLSWNLQVVSRTMDSIMHNPDAFVSGRFYYPRGNKDNHPFFLDYNWKAGSVTYEKERFPVSMLKYDIENDVLVMMKIIDNMGYSIQLDKRAIPEFCIDEHHFVYVDEAGKPGYYEQLYDAATRVWVKWTKWHREVENPVFGKSMYVYKTYYAIEMDRGYYEVKRLKDIYNVFSDKKKEIREFKKDHKLSFRKDRSNTIILLTEHYDNLND